MEAWVITPRRLLSESTTGIGVDELANFEIAGLTLLEYIIVSVDSPSIRSNSSMDAIFSTSLHIKTHNEAPDSFTKAICPALTSSILFFKLFKS